MPPREVPIEALSFPAYRLADADGMRRRPAAFQSLGHWFEAEKFRAFQPDLFDVVMLQPSVKEARKFATQHQPQWRGDWLGVRTRALACGMYYAWQADPAPERWMASASDIIDLLAPLGLPSRFVPGAATEFIRLRAAQRIAFLGAGAAPQDVVGRRVNMVHKKQNGRGAWSIG
jgi:hypothetical protein